MLVDLDGGQLLPGIGLGVVGAQRLVSGLVSDDPFVAALADMSNKIGEHLRLEVKLGYLVPHFWRPRHAFTGWHAPRPAKYHQYRNAGNSELDGGLGAVAAFVTGDLTLFPVHYQN